MPGGSKGAKTWNSATSQLGNNSLELCRRLKAFKEAKVLIKFNETIPRRSIREWPKRKAATLEDLIVNYKLDRNDLLDKRKGHYLVESMQLLR